MKKIFLILFLIKNVLVLYAQYDDPYQYYPMAVGNYWYYSAGPNNFHTIKVYADSTDNVGNRFFWLSDRSHYPNSPPGYRIDTNYYWMVGSLGPEYQLKLDARLGEKWWLFQTNDTTHGKYCELTSEFDGEYLGIKTRFKKYTVFLRLFENDTIYDFYDHYEILAYGIGMVYHDNDSEYPYELLGAIIDGKIIGNPVGIEENITEKLPGNFELFQNYPNPFNPSTTITYKIPEASHVELKVYDILGREILTLVDEYQRPGIYHSTFSVQHSLLASGVYYYSLISGTNIITKPMILIK